VTLLFLGWIFLLGGASAAESPPPAPIYLALQPNLNLYGLFADGGWDGNWYVGYDSCWIVELPPAPKTPFVKAYLGARLGRAKRLPGKAPWEKQNVVPGQIFIAVSSAPFWDKSRQFPLTESSDIPVEPDPENAILGAGNSQWFWTEIPARLVQTDGPNYVAVWSSTPQLLSVSSSPILAAAWGGKDTKAWLNRTVHETPTISPNKALETSLSYFLPALAIKLIPPNSSQVLLSGLQVSSTESPKKEPMLQAGFSMRGEILERAYLEASPDGKTWKRFGSALHSGPLLWTLKKDELPAGKMFFLRGVAQDWLGNQGTTPAWTAPSNPTEATQQHL